MKKTAFIFLLLIILVSCRSNYKIFVSRPSSSFNEIHGYDLKKFFNSKNDIRKIKIKDEQLLSKEIGIIKDSLNKVPSLPDAGERFGIYKFAFIVSKDTLYSTSTLKGWRYQNKVGKYEIFSSMLRAEILKASEE